MILFFYILYLPLYPIIVSAFPCSSNSLVPIRFAFFDDKTVKIDCALPNCRQDNITFHIFPRSFTTRQEGHEFNIDILDCSYESSFFCPFGMVEAIEPNLQNDEKVCCNNSHSNYTSENNLLLNMNQQIVGGQLFLNGQIIGFDYISSVYKVGRNEDAYQVQTRRLNCEAYYAQNSEASGNKALSVQTYNPDGYNQGQVAYNNEQVAHTQEPLQNGYNQEQVADNNEHVAYNHELAQNGNNQELVAYNNEQVAYPHEPAQNGYNQEQGAYNHEQVAYPHDPAQNGYNHEQGAYNHEQGTYNNEQFAYPHDPTQNGYNQEQGAYNNEQFAYPHEQAQNGYNQEQGAFIQGSDQTGYNLEQVAYNNETVQNNYNNETFQNNYNNETVQSGYKNETVQDGCNYEQADYNNEQVQNCSNFDQVVSSTEPAPTYYPIMGYNSETCHSMDCSNCEMVNCQSQSHCCEKCCPMNSPMFCFSGDMEIETYEGTKKMMDLKIDEYVQAFPSYYQYDNVHAFLHRLPEQEAEFIQFILTNDKILKITPNHLIYIVDCNQEYSNEDIKRLKTVPSQSVNLNDCLLSWSEDKILVPTTIKSINIVKERGIYAPLTVVGNILVNGIYTSCYSVSENYSLLRGVSGITRIFNELRYLFGLTEENLNNQSEIDIPFSTQILIEISRILVPDEKLFLN